MEIRYFQVISNDGKVNEPVLQYWNGDKGLWENIPLVRVPEELVEKALKTRLYK
jgi:hypothetical protein